MPGYQIHFTMLPKTQNADNEDTISCEVEPGDLVEPDMLLVSLVPVHGENQEQVQLEAGIDTELTDSGIVSCDFGYPQLQLRKKGDELIVQVSLIPIVFTGVDMMEAKLRLPPSLPKGWLPTVDRLETILQALGICFGIDRYAIERGLKLHSESENKETELLIARGRAPNHGRDSYLRMEIEIGPLPGTMLADGSIDFRERKMFVGVKKGELLATRIPAEKGRAGTNLLGETIPAKDGKEIQVKVSDDTSFNEEDGTIRATASGVLCVVGDNSLRVCSSQRIEGNVDYGTGNIRSQNSVEIGGSVLPGFQVNTRGNLVVEGNVEAASIVSGGNIEVKGGIVGALARVSAKGDIDVKYTEHATLCADGNIIVRASGYYANLEAGANIHCPEGVKLVGGRVMSGGSISASHIGGVATEPMEVIAGVDPYRFRRHQSLLREYHELLVKIQRHNQFRGTSGSIEDSDRKMFEARLQELARELEKLNLIQGSDETSLGRADSWSTTATITVHDLLAAGTVLRIGNDTMVVHRDLAGCVIRYDAFHGGLRCVEHSTGEVVREE